MTNGAKERMLGNKPAVGIGLGMESVLTAEAVSKLDFDFVLMDRQHGNWSLEGIMNAVRPICLHHSVPIVRVRANEFSEIGQVLDRGALGIVVPMVNTPEEAEKAVFAARYPPRGGRSVGFFGAELYGSDYFHFIERELYVGVQIETVESVKNIKQILSVDGIDGCCVGPKDLALSMGIDLHSDEGAGILENTILDIRNACLEAGKIPGILGGNASYWFEKGFLLAITGSDKGYIVKGAEHDLKALSR